MQETSGNAEQSGETQDGRLPVTSDGGSKLNGAPAPYQSGRKATSSSRYSYSDLAATGALERNRADVQVHVRLSAAQRHQLEAEAARLGVPVSIVLRFVVDRGLVIRADDKVREAPPTAVPLSLWNPVLVDSDVAVDPKGGSVQPMKVIDRGVDKVVIQGKQRPAHHYEIVTSFPQEVWYDDNDQLVQVELKGSDGSTIRYQLI